MHIIHYQILAMRRAGREGKDDSDYFVTMATSHVIYLLSRQRKISTTTSGDGGRDVLSVVPGKCPECFYIGHRLAFVLVIIHTYICVKAPSHLTSICSPLPHQLTTMTE